MGEHELLPMTQLQEQKSSLANVICRLKVAGERSALEHTDINPLFSKKSL